MTVSQASPEQAAAMRTNVRRLGALWHERVMPSVAARWVWWQSVKASARKYGVNPAAIIGPELAAHNAKLDVIALDTMRIVQALDDGRAEVRAWAQPSESGHTTLHFGFAMRGAVPLEGLGVVWFIPPVITFIKFATGAALVGGGFVVADGWMDARQLEAEADLTLQQVRLKSIEAIRQVSAKNPRAGNALAAALQKADLLSGKPKGALDKLANAAAGVAEGVGEAARKGGDMLPILAALWFFSQRGKA